MVAKWQLRLLQDSKYQVTNSVTKNVTLPKYSFTYTVLLLLVFQRFPVKWGTNYRKVRFTYVVDDRAIIKNYILLST